MAVSSILSDELLDALIAVGQVDVLVGLPTLNHADSLEPVLKATHIAFHNHFARERTVLLNCDGGSTDGTTDLVRAAPLAEGESFLTAQSLRTRHRISVPYHGVPGKATAIQTIFAAADLLQARAVAVLDPEIVSVTADSLAALLRPALEDGIDFVSPAYARHPLDGPLVTQIVRPLFRASFGPRLQEPLAGEFGCSGRFAAQCLTLKHWASDELRVAIDLWLSAVAASNTCRIGEALLGPRQLASRPRPGTSGLVAQVLDAFFTCLRLLETVWTVKPHTDPILRHGRPEPPPAAAIAVDVEEDATRFREGLAAFESMLERALRPETLDTLRACAVAPEGPLQLPDELWAATVVDLAVAHRQAALSRDHLVQAAVPLYLGRVAAFATAAGGEQADVVQQRLEDLSREFERLRPQLVELWTAAGR